MLSKRPPSYVALDHGHPELTGHFSQETQTFTAAYGTKPTK
jgi:hypothetical protein